MAERGYPKYQMVKDHIIKQINKREVLPGGRIPSENRLAELLDVSIITVRKAMSELVNENIIYRSQGRGSFVCEQKELATSKTDASMQLVAFVVSAADHYDGSLMQMIKGAQSCLSKKGLSLMIEYTNGDLETERETIERLANQNVSGVLIFSVDPKGCESTIRRLKNRGIPFVMIDRKIPSFPVNFVASDNFDGAYRAVEYLIMSGHDRIAFISDNSSLSSEKERYQGYRNALKIAEIDTIDDVLLFDIETLNTDAFVRMVHEHEITAAFAVNDVTASKIVNVCTNNDIGIPSDLSIIGFDDISLTKMGSIHISTVKQFFYEMAYEAVKILVVNIEKPHLGCRNTLIPTELIIRNSSGINNF